MPEQKTDIDCVLCCHIAGVFDVNRQSVLQSNDFSALDEWLTAIVSKGLRAIIFHNHFTAATCARHAHPLLQYKRVRYNNAYNPNVFRYFVYRDFLKQAGNKMGAVFMTDATDVLMQQNPFTQPYFLQNRNYLFCGDEPKILNNNWMRAHGQFFRKQSEKYALFEEKFANQTLLNCGILGGSTALVLTFLEILCAFHQEFNQHNPTAYTGDMGAFNYVARTHFDKLMLHGEPVNTVFKQYEVTRQDCWFQHK